MVTAYFNPAGWESRRRNYRLFRRRLALPLLTVELAGSRGADLTEADADRYLRVVDGDVMWQKERLLNLGIAALPRHVTHVAWLDCDVVFARDDWWRSALVALDEFEVVQPFERIVHLPRPSSGPRIGRDAAGERSPVEEGVAVALALGVDRRAPASLGELPVRHRCAAGRLPVAKGCAWAARRETIEPLGLYDREIVGGGDGAALAAFAGDAPGLSQAVSAARRRGLGERYLDWAAKVYERVGGRIGAVPGDVFHLWHGPFEQRRYATRYEPLASHRFDADRDLRFGRDGAWRWASEKPGLHAAVASYFTARAEDDVGPTLGESRVVDDARRVAGERR